MPRPFKCPYCGEGNSVSKGVRKTKTLGDRRIRFCKACRRKFTPKNQHPPASAEEGPQIQEPPAEPQPVESPDTPPTPAQTEGQAESPTPEGWTS